MSQTATKADRATDLGAGRAGFHPRIEALRGVAALTVAAFHAGQTPYALAGGGTGMLAFGDRAGWSALRTAYSWLLNGHGAVVLFFVISGFVLSLSLDRMRGSMGQIAGLFLARRLLRLWPPIVFMVAVFAVFYLAAGLVVPGVEAEAYSPMLLLRHALLIESQINGVVWTLQVEAFAAPCILLAWLAARRGGTAALWLLFTIFLLASFAGAPDQLLARFGLPPVAYVNSLHAFIGGMLIPSWAAFLTRLAMPRAATTLYPIFGVALVLCSPHVFGLGSNYRLVGETLGSVALVTGVVMGMNPLVGRFLDIRLIRFYGRISYSFYLLHPLALTVLWAHPDAVAELVNTGMPTVVLAVLALVISVAAITPLAMLSYALAEAPSITVARLRPFALVGFPRPRLPRLECVSRPPSNANE